MDRPLEYYLDAYATSSFTPNISNGDRFRIKQDVQETLEYVNKFFPSPSDWKDELKRCEITNKRNMTIPDHWMCAEVERRLKHFCKQSNADRIDIRKLCER